LEARAVLSGPWLTLHALTAQDAEAWLAGSDPGASAFALDYPSPFATELLRLVALYPVTDLQVDEYGCNLGPWVVEHRDDGVLIGTVSCARLMDPSEVSVGYDIAPPYRGRGHATEALTIAVEHLLGVPGIERVCADTLIDHVASRRVMEKAGLRWRSDEVEEHDGREVKLAHYAIDRPDPI
jgi:RimJ/RimL family protein N-acetyltransferase